MSESLKATVREKYAAVARSSMSSRDEGTRRVAEAFGYSAEELASIPAEANMALSCGNPTATAGLREGEVVLDLGCGGGLDVFLAARKVGPSGRAIGLDMTQDMIDRAKANAAKAGLDNTQFVLGEIEAIPLESDSVDCVISNCVINLVPDKGKAFREIHRVLKPGGRLAISDIALKQPLPDELGNDLMAYIGCIAGAILIADYEAGLAEAGFSAVEIIDAGADLNAYAHASDQSVCCPPAMASDDPLAVVDSGCCAPVQEADDDLHARLTFLLQKYDVNAYAASVKVFAVKPD